MIHVRWQRRGLTPEQLARGEIRINCPECGAKDAPVADVWFEDETAQLIIKRTTSWVKCGACGAVLYSSDPADTLPGRTPSQLEGVVRRRISPIKKVLVTIACCVFFMPGLGLECAGCVDCDVVDARRLADGGAGCDGPGRPGAHRVGDPVHDGG